MSPNYLELLDWRRQMADIFSEVRRRGPSSGTLAWFRARKDGLFREHPQSPLPPAARAGFTGLSYWPHDPEARVEATIVAAMDVATAANEQSLAIGHLEFTYRGAECRLGAFWIAGYGGGLFVPFRDATSGTETYGGGRYVHDSIKSADLGSDFQAGTVVLDFNYAYHPSCAYDPVWSCPLAPASNRLDLAIRAGERL
ncbi:MAG TPA: DUF1684 domain-containing protein [Chloroflexota bacterium]|nr:DUF1684 domain-containing protein [Chloroflexota bacterium]